MIKIIQKNDAVKLLLKKERQKIHFERIRTYRFFNLYCSILNDFNHINFF